METDIFISYARRDWDLVKPFYERLTELGYEVWIDKDGIESGDAFKKVILKAIKSSRCLVFFSSENSNSSKWTAKEIGVAVKKEIPIIPVLFDKSDYNEEVEFDLVNLDYTDCSKPDEREEQMKRFLESIKKKLGPKTPQATVPIAEVSSPATCEIHFETDTPCDIYQFKKLVGHVEPDDDCILSLKPGRYKFEFVNSANSEHRYPLVYTVDNVATDFIQIELSKNGLPQAKSDIKPPKTEAAARPKPEVKKETKPLTEPKQKTPPQKASSSSSNKSKKIKLEEGDFIVFIQNAGNNKLAVLEVLVNGLGLPGKDAEDLLNLAPVNLVTGVSLNTADTIVKALTSSGAIAHIAQSAIFNPGTRIKVTQGNYSVLLNNRWPSWKAVDILVTCLGYEHWYADRLVDSAPVNVISNVSQRTAKKLYDAFTEVGVKAEIINNITAQTQANVSTGTPISQLSPNSTQTKKAGSSTKKNSRTSGIKEFLEDYTPLGQVSKIAKIVKKSTIGYLKKK